MNVPTKTPNITFITTFCCNFHFVNTTLLVPSISFLPKKKKKKVGLNVGCREMEDYIMKLVVFGVVSWTTGFLVIRRVLPNKSFEFCNRIVSTIHAISAVILASLSVQDWTSPVSPSASKSSPIQVLFRTEYSVFITFSYFK